VNRRVLSAYFALALCLGLAGSAGALDAGIDAGAQWNSGPWPLLAVSLGQSLTDDVYLSIDANESLAVLDARATASWTTTLATVGAQVGWEQTTYPAVGTGRLDVGGYVSASLPLMGDLAVVATSLQYKTDLVGHSLTVKISPTLYLPLANPVMVGLVVAQNLVTSGYSGTSWTGAGALSVGPQTTISLASEWAVSASAGYAFDLSGGSFLGGPYGNAKLSWSHGF